MNRHRIRVLTMIAALLLVALPGQVMAATGRAKYTALGDSIAVGYGATNDYGYVDYFSAYLKTLYAKVDLVNDAVPGLDSEGLLLELQYASYVRDDTQKANVLTISIGGNNLLPCASNNYTSLNTTCAAAGVALFKYNWPQILSTIRQSIGSRAGLYVMTLYNPYTGTDPEYATADQYITQINAAIQNSTYMTTYQYKVADVYTDFKGQFPNGTWKVCDWTHFCESARDPHPTDAGHQEIARLHELIYSTK